MRRLITLIVCLYAIQLSSSYAQSAKDIVEKSDQQMRGDSSYTQMTMKIVRPDWTRSMSMKSWTKGKELSMVLVTSPAKDKGSASLKRDREMWNWVPNIERIIKIAPSMLSQSWMGSDFTNDDLINQSSIVVDYTHKLQGEEKFDDEVTYVVDAFAKPDAPVVWSKVRLWISSTNYLQRKVEFYDEFDELVNQLQTFDIKKVGGRFIATRMEMIPVDEPGNRTEIITHDASFNFEISDEFFSQAQMKSLRD
ncbi:outer membrane lipoprotein-sorting protein [Vibrio hannami]|uniref:outer membrane lipoprotein-sorting protein n=1 Tax=Vibrio hannami TaxID=2717094 RepID=UPI00240ED11E|nr:outer membrane lipoprotein-sorting protein [Vibrio hannami]MDG3085403.1 outer membrane lipoprotein-sorting protein [Vibrio hannami]